MLYPVVDFAYPPTDGLYSLPQGNMGVFQFTVAPGQRIMFKMAQVIGNYENIPQDQSIRCWVSFIKGGASVHETPITAKQWHLSALLRDDIVVYDSTSVEVEPPTIGIPVEPGAYWLNVLNLVNQPNMFSFVLGE
jgi:hypothetical protein